MSRKTSSTPVSLESRLSLAKALVDRRILANIYSVSRSGMSRKLQFVIATADRDTNRIGFMRATHLIAQIAGYPYNRDDLTLKKDGCGSDAVNDVICSLAYWLSQDDELIANLCTLWECNKQEAIMKLEEATRQSVFCL